MNDTKKHELIERLHGAAQQEEAGIPMGETVLADLMLKAATALEDTLWKPIEYMPDKLWDGDIQQ